MIFIIFGTTSRAKTIDSGRFFCPECSSKRSYELKEVTRYGHLYFIPVVPLDKISTYVECNKCGGTFVPAVLKSRLQRKSRRLEARFHKGVRGVLVHMMLADGEGTDIELETVRRVYRSVTGSALDEKQLRKQAKSGRWIREMGLLASLGSLSNTLNDQGKEVILRAATRVATANGRVEKDEHALLRRIAEALDITKRDTARVLQSIEVRPARADSTGAVPLRADRSWWDRIRRR